jgi:hypothetical protein
MGDAAAIQTFTTQQMFTQLAVPSGMFYGVSTLVDRLGNVFVGYVEFPPANNNLTFVHVRKYGPNNNTTVLAEWRVNATANFKMDAVSLAPRGFDILVVVVTHTSVAGPARTRAVEIAIIPNVLP